MGTIITKTDAEALIPEEIAPEVFKSTVENSMILRLARRLPNMARGVRSLPVMSALPVAYFVDGTPGEPTDNTLGRKELTDAAWQSKKIYAEEVAVIVPIPQSVLDDADYDIWGEIKPYIGQAFGKALDNAVLFGVNAPASWPTDIVAGAIAASNAIQLGAIGDLFDDIMGYDETVPQPGLIALVEEDGYFPTGFVAGVSMRGKLRGLRATTNGLPLFRPALEGMQPGTGGYTLDGQPIYFAMNQAWDDTAALMIAGDWNQLVYAFRTDISYKVLDQAIIQDPATGNILFNLAQQDMVALRCYMRFGWQLPNPVNITNETAATRYPFSVLTPVPASP